MQRILQLRTPAQVELDILDGFEDDVWSKVLSLNDAIAREDYVAAARFKDELEEVQHALAFVRSAEQLANSIRLDANNGKNTVLAPYASGASFKHCWNFWRPRGKKHSKLRVGGIAQQLYKDVVDQMYDWILDCDEAMCVAHGDRGDEHDDACMERPTDGPSNEPQLGSGSQGLAGGGLRVWPRDRSLATCGCSARGRRSSQHLRWPCLYDRSATGSCQSTAGSRPESRATRRRSQQPANDRSVRLLWRPAT